MTPRFFVATGFLMAGMAGASLAHAAQPTEQQVEQDFGHLSQDGLRSFADVDIAGRAIAVGNISTAKDALKDANRYLLHAQRDNHQFMLQESELHPASRVPDGHSGRLPSADQSSGRLGWLPILGEYIEKDPTQSQPDHAKALADANSKLKSGNTKEAAASLSKAGENVEFVLAVAPLKDYQAVVHRASELLTAGKTGPAMDALTEAQESVRFVSQDFTVAADGKTLQPVPATSAPATSAPATSAPATSAPAISGSAAPASGN
ncbi:YfdX family protein [Acetobacter estunensis]|nr:YfdX family protein [Acetobacter estunensis]